MGEIDNEEIRQFVIRLIDSVVLQGLYACLLAISNDNAEFAPDIDAGLWPILADALQGEREECGSILTPQDFEPVIKLIAEHVQRSFGIAVVITVRVRGCITKKIRAEITIPSTAPSQSLDKLLLA